MTYLDRIRNEDILKSTEQKEVTEMIKERRLRWLGHVLRMRDDRFPKNALQWSTQGKRGRGRPRLTWQTTVERDLKDMGLSWEDVATVAGQREVWRMRTARGVDVDTGGTKV